MKTLFVASREIGYSRNDVNLRALRRFSKVDVVGVVNKPVSLTLTSLTLGLLASLKLLYKTYDLVFIGFYGHLLIPQIRILTSRPILFDAFLSTYDTLTGDRQTVGAKSLNAQLAWWLDRTACRISNRVLLDTSQHVDFFTEEFQLPRNLFISCPVGCNEDIFSPRTHKKFYERTQVTYYTSYLPVHGVDIVVKAALKLRSEPINFRIIGRGQTYKSVRKLAGRYMLDNIEFLPEMPIEKIADQIAISDICLGGHFGSTEKASRVVPGKVYQILAMQRPLIASNTSANLDLFQDSEAALLCPNGDPDALADAILCLHEDSQFRESLAAKGRQLYLEKCSEVVITDILRKTIIGLLKE